jgi:phage terminase large subunit-like protein
MTRAQTTAAYQQVATKAELRALLAGDLFFLLLIGMGRSDINNDFLFARCREVQAGPDGHLDLWAREHYKSTIITVGLTIQDILNNPDISVGIFSHTRPIAKAFLRQIKREFESNMLLRELFPHICPPQKGEKRTWSEDEGIIVRRSSNPKEATVEAWGLVDGQPTSKHFTLLIYDDVVTLESVGTPEMIRKTSDAWRMSLNLGAHGGKRRMIGTRYHAADSYAEILEAGSAVPRLYPATADGTAEGDPVFLSRQVLAEKRRDMGPFVFACQMLQNPLADKAQGFAPEWFKSADGELRGEGMNIYITVDPASSRKAGSDYTAMWVIGLNVDGNYYVLDGVRDRLNLTERARVLFALHRKWRPIYVGYERYGMQADVEHMRELMERENYRFKLVELGGQMPKPDRIRRLAPLFEQGRIWFPLRLMKMRQDNTAHDLTDEFYRQEYLSFPVCGHDDMLDCLARILDPDLRVLFPQAQDIERQEYAARPRGPLDTYYQDTRHHYGIRPSNV